MRREKLTLEIICANPTCGKVVVLTGIARANALRRGGRGYCHPPAECGKVSRRTRCAAAATVRYTDPAERERQKIMATLQSADPAERARRSERAKAQMADPAARTRMSDTTKARMADPAARAYLSETMKRLGIQPDAPRCGSNGVPAPREAMLLEALQTVQAGWVLHHHVPRLIGALDLPIVSVAVEVDGRKHNKTAQKARDRAKENFLMSRGWRVIRISNQSVLNDLEWQVAFITRVASRPAAAQEVAPW